MFHREEPDVLVVGAGPVGLLAGLLLHARGLRVEIIDEGQRTSQHSYALALHPQSLRLLDEVGIASVLESRGRPLPRLSFYEGTERRAVVDFARLEGGKRRPVIVRQSFLERAIEEELAKHRVTVRWNHRLASLEDDGDRSLATIAKLDQVAQGYPVQRMEWVVVRNLERSAAFVVGADGYDSAVRRMSGMPTKAFGGSMMSSIFEFEAEGELPDEARVQFDGDATHLYWPLETGRCRCSFEVQSAGEHDSDPKTLARFLADKLPWFRATPVRILWSTVAVFERRVAESFGTGNRWLAGDAAHLGLPMGVHSMNYGLQEAKALADGIAAVVRGGAPRTRLAEYAAASRAEWQQRFDGAGIEALPDAASWVRDHRLRIADCIPASGEELDALLGELRLKTSRVA